MTAAQVIQSAYEDLGLIIAGETMASADIAMGLSRLNQLVKQWQGNSDLAPGLKVWTRQRLNLFSAVGQARYLVGPAATDDRASANTLVTTSTAARAANGTTLLVTSGTGVTNADIVGIVLSDGTLGWTTLTSGGGTTTWTLAANTLGASSSGAIVYTYTSKAQRFVELESVKLRDWSIPTQPIDIDVAVYTEVKQYEAVTQKLAPGDPLAILVEPQRLNTVVTCNFAAANMYKTLRMTVIYPAEDYDSSSGADDISFPQEWFSALSWELAFRLAPSAGIWTKEMDMNHTNALIMARSLNPMNTVSHFQPGKD